MLRIAFRSETPSHVISRASSFERCHLFALFVAVTALPPTLFQVPLTLHHPYRRRRAPVPVRAARIPLSHAVGRVDAAQPAQVHRRCAVYSYVHTHSTLHPYTSSLTCLRFRFLFLFVCICFCFGLALFAFVLPSLFAFAFPFSFASSSVLLCFCFPCYWSTVA
jgi:hypothetical protein